MSDAADHFGADSIVGLTIDPATLKKTLTSIIGVVAAIEAVAPLDPATKAVLMTINNFATQDWFVQLIVALAAIPDHLKPAAAAALITSLQNS